MAKINSDQLSQLLLQAEQRLEGNPSTITPSEHALDKTEAVAPVAAVVPKEKEGSVRVVKHEKSGNTKTKVRWPFSHVTPLSPCFFDGDEKEPLTVP